LGDPLATLAQDQQLTVKAVKKHEEKTVKKILLVFPRTLFL
jgi:hypothetical protein